MHECIYECIMLHIKPLLLVLFSYSQLLLEFVALIWNCTFVKPCPGRSKLAAPPPSHKSHQWSWASWWDPKVHVAWRDQEKQVKNEHIPRYCCWSCPDTVNDLAHKNSIESTFSEARMKMMTSELEKCWKPLIYVHSLPASLDQQGWKCAITELNKFNSVPLLESDMELYICETFRFNFSTRPQWHFVSKVCSKVLGNMLTNIL